MATKSDEQETKAVAPRLSEAIREALEEDLITGAIAPGTRLDEMELAARFGASRTPVREALQQLAAAALIEIRPRRGAIVPQLDPHTILDMFETMAELEAVCAKLAARRMTDEDRRAITLALERSNSVEASDPDEYYHRNEAFHRALYRASHNRFLEEQTLALQRRLRTYRRLQLRLPSRMEASRAEHVALTEALLTHDADRAATLACSHVELQSTGFGDFMALLRPMAGGAALR
jgi:DNA-binding GntR family transcriptional regulator